MGLAIRMAVAVTPPVVIGVLVWWGVMLATPVVLLRRWRRRRRGAPRLRLWPRVVTRRPESTAPAGSEIGGVVPGHMTTGAARVADAGAAAQRSAAFPPPLGQTPPPGRPGSRAGVVMGLPREALEPLCRYVDFHRRLELAVSELERRLSRLPSDRWRVEPYPLTGSRRNTLLLFGETGVFVISATYAPGHWDDVIAASKLARKVQVLLPGYVGQVQPAICHPFTAAAARLWHRPDEDGRWVGAWVLGGDSVIDWLEHFGAEHGLRPADLKLFDELAKPNWLKPAIPTAPSWPEIPEAAPPGTWQ